MIIDGVYNVISNKLCSIKYAEYGLNEFDRVFESWDDAIFLAKFFRDNEADLKSGFYGEISKEQAIDKTITEAEEFEDYLCEIIELIELGEDVSLDHIFKPLHNNVYGFIDLQKSKATGIEFKSWLRLYAIRISANKYIITGGAIKLTLTMNEREHLKVELRKFDLVKQFLIDEGLMSEADFN